MFTYFHCYMPETWEGQVKAGLINEHSGIRFCESILLEDKYKFNNLAKKDGDLYKMVKENKMPFYIDRLQGGCYIENYDYDMDLVNEYKEMLGDKFYGFQMHEWMSNYRNDLRKIYRNNCAEWTAEEITKAIKREFNFENLFLESMTLDEMTNEGRADDLDTFVKVSENLFKKRQDYTGGYLVPADSYYLAYPIELKMGAKYLMPEIGDQIPNTRVQVAYARGMAKAYKIPFGTYYEPWGGSPFSACCYQRDNLNEWNLNDAGDFPFVTMGENGGSSRSLQKRMQLYSYMAGAEFISEEWGMCNTFYDWKTFELSPYGQVKKDFIDFTEKYNNIGKPIVPIAAVISKDIPVVEVELNKYHLYMDYPVNDELKKKIDVAYEGLRKLLMETGKMIGTETVRLLNCVYPDAIDVVNSDVINVDDYSYIVDLTDDKEFAEKNKDKIIAIEDVLGVLDESLPVKVEGTLLQQYTKNDEGTVYMMLTNNSGIVRSVEKGEIKLPEATETAIINTKGKKLAVLDTDGECIENADGTYTVTLPAGGHFFASI